MGGAAGPRGARNPPSRRLLAQGQPFQRDAGEIVLRAARGGVAGGEIARLVGGQALAQAGQINAEFVERRRDGQIFVDRAGGARGVAGKGERMDVR